MSPAGWPRVLLKFLKRSTSIMISATLRCFRVAWCSSRTNDYSMWRRLKSPARESRMDCSRRIARGFRLASPKDIRSLTAIARRSRFARDVRCLSESDSVPTIPSSMWSNPRVSPRVKNWFALMAITEHFDFPWGRQASCPTAVLSGGLKQYRSVIRFI
jgi:hypothetical protein